MSDFDILIHLTQSEPNNEQPLVRQRRVPSQPPGVTPGRVNLGSDLGEVAYEGEKPRVGDIVLVIGLPGRQIVRSGMRQPSFRMPTFSEICVCKCPSRNGTIFWANPIQTGPYIIVMDGDGNLKQTINPPEIHRIAGIAADPDSPFKMYVLDDRTRLDNFKNDASPDTQIAGVSTYVLHTFANGGAAYTWASATEMADPGLPAAPFFVSELDWVTDDDGQLEDPPAAYPTNCMTVIDGLLYITMSKRPARYLTWNGTTFTTHNLLQNGANYNKGLRGMVVTGLDRPGQRTRKFVLAWLGFDGFAEDGSGSYEVLEFDDGDNITRQLTGDAVLKSPTALQAVCNRLLVLNSNVYGRTEDGGSGSLNGSLIPVGSPP